jgi:uncharacterized surface protein with fasciclin (FAS1) repeats
MMSPPAVPQRFQLITVVWGEWYIDIFLRFNIPSLLASGNIPDLCARQQGRYVIHTRQSESERIRSSAAFAMLARCLPVELVAHPDEFFEGNPHTLHGTLWRAATDNAAERSEWIAFIAADIVLAEGALRHLADQFAAGKTIVYGFTLRVTEHTFLPNLQHESDGTSAALAISPRALTALALNHLAPLYICYLRETRHFGYHPELLLYPVPGEGIVLRAFVAHCIALDPRRCELAEGLEPRAISDPLDIGFLTDSDAFAVVSITPASHQVHWWFDRRRSDIIEAAWLWRQIGNFPCRYLARQSFLFHHGAMTPAKWRRTIARADANAMLTFLTMKFMWAVHVLQNTAGTRLAADVIAWALVGRKLHKCCVSRGKLTILVPSDAAFERLAPGAMARMLAGPRRCLATVLRDHCLSGDLQQVRDGDAMSSLSGRKFSISVSADGIRVAGCLAREVAVDTADGSNVRVYACDAALGEWP